MKIKEGYLLSEVAGNHVVIPVGNVSFNGMLNLNETGVLIWKKLELGCEEDELVQAFLAEYDVSAERAKEDVSAFVKKLKAAGIIEDDKDFSNE